MKTLSILLISALLLPTIALSKEKPKIPSREDVLKAVETFAKSPLSAQGKAAASMIAKFSEESDDVSVIFSVELVPWLEKAKQPKYSDTLLAAYIAGNVKSQLERRTNANDSYAGLLQLLKTYAQLKEADKKLNIPEIEKFVDLEAKKQLKKYVDDVFKEGEKQPLKLK